MKLLSMVIEGDSGRNHVIAVSSAGAPTCTCEAYRYAKQIKTCKHIAFVAGLLVN